MSLIERIEDGVKAATLARDASRRDALRLILVSLRSAEKDLQRPLSEGEELQVLQRERKRRIEAAEAFRAGGREEQAAKEEGELAILEEFMPAPLGEEELEQRRWRGKLGGHDVVLVDRPGRGYGDDYSPFLVDAPVGGLVRVRAEAVTEEGILAVAA